MKHLLDISIIVYDELIFIIVVIICFHMKTIVTDIFL